jgi:ABC-3C biological conflict system middle component
VVEVTPERIIRSIAPFNGPVEIGLRALVVLNDAFPAAYTLRRLVIFDYLLVHSDDVPGGPTGLHPKTPHRSGELLVRRSVLQEGLLLYQSRGLVERHYERAGLFFSATERSSAFLDVLRTEYVIGLRERAAWLVASFGQMPEADLEQVVRESVGAWGAEFAMESVLWAEEAP